MITKYPRFVQRASYIPNDSRPTKRKDFDRYFRWNYMGSSEFERGALARLCNNLMHDFLSDFMDWEVNQKIDLSEHSCWYVGPRSQLHTAEAFFEDQLGPREWDLKERTNIQRSYGPNADATFDADAWFAIPGNFVMGNYGKFEHIGGSDRPFVLTKTKVAARAVLKAIGEREARWKEETK